MDYTTYTTKDNDRWDLIAFAAYGALKLSIQNDEGVSEEADAMDLIIQANRAIPVDAILDAGIVLRIPIVEFIETKTERLPPWKR
jgi:hypothetical protein